jgi:uncharacterized protein
MHPSLRQIEHRPWPLPHRPWVLQQAWLDLAFLHGRVAAGDVQRRLPRGVRVQEFDGSAWLGLVPFRLAAARPRGVPAAVGLPVFPEFNVRTYVEVGGKPGVWFFSLDADSWPVVLAGRGLFALPYFPACMRHRRDGDRHEVVGERRRGGPAFSARYRPTGVPFLARPGTFAHWATERYCLYTHSPRLGLSRVEVHHPPWPLQEAEVEMDASALRAAAGFPGEWKDQVVHFSSGVEVVSYPREALDGDAAHSDA